MYKIVQRHPEVFKHAHLEEMDRETFRHMAFKQMRLLNAEKDLDYEKYLSDPNISSMMGIAVYMWSPSHCVKHGVHFYLYAKTIKNLGTEKHQA